MASPSLPRAVTSCACSTGTSSNIDCYRDLMAHALLEVAPHGLTGGKTNPVTVYVLRWIAGRRAGVPEFAPPYCLDS